MMTNDNLQLNIPKRTDLPFFAYGIFKPGQLAYSKIEEFVRNSFPCQINYRMLMRDGVPLIEPDESIRSKTMGFLIYFYKDSYEEAYKIISETEPGDLYQWKEIYVGENKANVLIGKNHKTGSSYIEAEVGNYDGRKDPFFKEVINLVGKELDDDFLRMNDIEGFLKLQMNYMLLWASIERYCSLKYDNKGSTVNKLSKDVLFKRSLKKYVESESRKVYSAEDLREYTLNPKKPYDSVRYYYTIRCNVVHRGKAFYNDEIMLRQSLTELLNIFRDILDETFKEKEIKI